MLLFVLATLCVSLTSGRVVDGEFLLVDGEEVTLSWPERHTVKVTKMSMTANLVEEFIIWRTNSSSRLDSNHGAVKSIVKLNYEDEEVMNYEIHPETDEEENVQLVCNSLSTGGGLRFGLEDVLPDVEYSEYKAIKNESMNNDDTIRFEYVDRREEEDDFHTLWAYNLGDGSNDSLWIPVKYELKEFNTKLGSLTKHEIWEYSDFDVDFDDEVFDVEEFGCGEEKVTKVTQDSDAVTKELKFINTENKNHVDHVFNSFKNKFTRKYAHDEEHNLRRNIFKQNLRMIASTNRQNLGYKLGVNQFTDRTPEEINRSRNLRSRPEGKTGTHPFPYTKETLEGMLEEIPTNVDLRINGLVSPVQNQGDCGSCWTFGTTSAVEGALARINGGRLMRLSNQALIDCAWAYGAAGCDGGSDNAAYEWMMEYGLPTEEEYGTYENKDGYCHIGNMSETFPIKGYTDVTPFSNNALKVALFNHGPLSVSVEATDKFISYSNGIYYEKDCGPLNLNHEVTLVGYGEQYGDLFWILKNSWGVNWGIDGFMLIAARDNNCGVATEPTYAVF